MVRCSSPVRVTISKKPAISMDCRFFFDFQRFRAFILPPLCLISKHEKREKNAVNANKNANRGKVNDRGLIRAPPEKRKRITFYGCAFRFDTIHAEKEIYFYAEGATTMIRIYLSRLLGERRMTQIDLARKTKIRPATINEYYNEFAVRVNLEHLDKICEVLDCNLDELIQRVPDKPF